MKTTLQIAVVGCGYWGPNLIRNVQSLPNCQVNYICDTDPKRLDHMKSLYPDINTTTSFDDVIHDDRVEAIMIATPVTTHFELGQKSLKAGKHTFIEKPLATTSEECHKLIEIADAGSLTLMVGHTFIYTAAVRKMKQLVEADELGEIYSIQSQRLNLGLLQKKINVAWDLAPHDLSIVTFVMGQLPLSVSCQGKAHVYPNVEDMITISLDFEGSLSATIQSSWLHPKKVREMAIIGSKKMVLYDDVEPIEKIKIYDKRVEAPAHYDTFAEFQFAYHYGDIHTPFLQQQEPLKGQCEHFVECIRQGTPPDTGGVAGLQVVEILEAASESLKQNGASVPITYSQMCLTN